MEDPELPEQIPFLDSWCIISTVPDPDLSLSLKKTLDRNLYDGEVFITALTEKDYWD